MNKGSAALNTLVGRIRKQFGEPLPPFDDFVRRVKRKGKARAFCSSRECSGAENYTKLKLIEAPKGDVCPECSCYLFWK